MELGADAVLVNTAIATAADTILMAKAFRDSVVAGRSAFEAGIASQNKIANATSPLTEFFST
jgi:thiazole synthase